MISKCDTNEPIATEKHYPPSPLTPLGQMGSSSLTVQWLWSQQLQGLCCLFPDMSYMTFKLKRIKIGLLSRLKRNVFAGFMPQKKILTCSVHFRFGDKIDKSDSDDGDNTRASLCRSLQLVSSQHWEVLSLEDGFVICEQEWCTVEKAIDTQNVGSCRSSFQARRLKIAFCVCPSFALCPSHNQSQNRRRMVFQSNTT